MQRVGCEETFLSYFAHNDLLVLILSYACPEAYQSLSLTCWRINALTKLPGFWERAKRAGLRRALALICVANIPEVVYEEFNLFLRFDKWTSYQECNLPWHAFLKWLFPDKTGCNLAVMSKDEWVTVHVPQYRRSAQKGWPVYEFRWTLDFQTGFVDFYNCDGMNIMAADVGALVSRLFYRTEPFLFADIMYSRGERWFPYVEWKCKNTHRIWRGRGRLTDKVPGHIFFAPDKSDPKGRWDKIKL